MPVFREIPYYNGLYKISRFGMVKKMPECGKCGTPTTVNQKEDDKGFQYVELTKDKVTEIEYVDNLVAMAFISNPEEKEEVRHINGNIKDNHARNLEWV